MPAAPAGTIRLTFRRSDGSRLSATLHHDPATGAWADPAVTVDGTGTGRLTVDTGTLRYSYLLIADVPVPPSVFADTGISAFADVRSVTLSEFGT